ncbi:cytochrome c oxidase subunit I [Rhodobacter sp. NSM]|uniref:cytochrome c oxidase subunit I n=1 Tax=Rhodobacter sp. NSM TaxID=3457501 RepID=UPI003FD6626B
MALSFFSGASFIITIPSAIAVFAWIATIRTGRPILTIPLLYCASFVVMFTIGGVSGVMTASVAADFQLHDTYFVVAHIHYVLIGINLFGVLAGIHFWLPKMTGRMMSPRLGAWAFGLIFTGFNAAFLQMHWTGLMGMPRRIYTYPEGAGWGAVNMVTTLGSFVMAVGILVFLVDVLRSLRSGPPAGPNPWDAPTLEWAVSSPPPPWNFATIPVVASRHPLWEDRLDEGTGRSSLVHGPLLDRSKEALVTTSVDAEPQDIADLLWDSLWPFFTTLALSLLFTALLLRGWVWAGAGVLALAACLLGWLWPRRSLGLIAEDRR